ncbi:MAG: MarR family transcriptional regulator [Hydrogenophaga sp.]|jgi:DNA-binding MarR family transcriptional regulator|nr:MarR family transcriptional regulator [Hydrogenophaga sp.]MDP3699857.1 MarR family transcriptional regulator [Hylemonella sp.]MDO9135387.1 MarR family transcriptional regulator [Hydrogenophaga sp.]MDO9506933.1 MarR family transcriptional regulator [Hydrogenophaga sp.]MDP2072603.1 MarR family transcriptional regulator [Hydrogenophaga sp.]MDP2251733.1 MarR family transcriptional regulator [Hydrogenophaga sp.]
MPETSTPTSTANAMRRPRGPRKNDTSESLLVDGATGSGAGDAPEVDTSYLETLLGYNARRAALTIIALFLRRMAPYDLRPVDFSVLTVVAHNPGVTSRQICVALDILPPNLVGMVKALHKRGLIERQPHPTDRRAQGLHLTLAGQRLHIQAQKTATELEQEATHALTPAELHTLSTLLRKVYRRPSA